MFESFILISVALSLFVVPVLGLFSGFFVWHTYGRDYWFRNMPFYTAEEKFGEVKPIGGHETLVVEYTSPDGLLPAEIGVLAHEKATDLDIVVTILDLAARGYIEITEKKTNGQNAPDYTLKKLDKSIKHLSVFEQELLQRLFKNDDKVLVLSLIENFYKDVYELKNILYDQIVKKKLFLANPQEIRRKYFYYSASIIIVCGVIFFNFMFVISRENVDLGLIIPPLFLNIGIAFASLLFLPVFYFMPRRTAYGRHLYRRIKGFKLFVEKTGKFDEHNKNAALYDKTLAYKVLFGKENALSKSLHDICYIPSE